MSFQQFMARCLYDPKHGYYARPDTATVSKKGDFMTSVSVGACFGTLLGKRLRTFHKKNGSPDDFTIVEIGAHDGSLCQDIRREFPEANYTIVEPLAERRKFLREKLGPEVIILEQAEKVSIYGALIANEVLDALPVPLLLFSSGAWHEVGVTANLEWTTLPELRPELKAFTEELGNAFPEGYVTEPPPKLAEFFAPLDRLFDHGLMTFVDYGLDAENLYSTSRTVGTLRCYHRHQTKVHPLDRLGQQDITADVNFTAVEKAASDIGYLPCPIMSQSRYLTHCAKEWLLSENPPSPKLLREFQTLIHPSQFGSRFYILELLKGEVEQAFP